VSVKKEDAWDAKTYVVQEEQIWGQPLRQVLLDTGLLASQELSHVGVSCELKWQVIRRKKSKSVERDGQLTPCRS
jgi:hypothetical protein